MSGETKQSVLREQTRFDATALLDLFELNGTNIGMQSIFYFCSATNANLKPVIFNGITYTPFPIDMTEMAYDGKGSLPRPKLTASNINGFISALLLESDDLTGAILTRRRVFARFIDAVNFPGGVSPYSPDPTAAYPDEPWIVNRKISENYQYVQWELCSPLELNQLKLPRRQIIANVCTPPVKYRDIRTCGYDGLPVADSANRTFASFYGIPTVTDTGAYSAATTYAKGDAVFIYSSLPQFAGIKIYYVCLNNGTVGVNPVGSPGNWVNDACSRMCSGCTLRFPGRTLRFGGFAGTSRANWVANG